MNLVTRYNDLCRSKNIPTVGARLESQDGRQESKQPQEKRRRRKSQGLVDEVTKMAATAPVYVGGVKRCEAVKAAAAVPFSFFCVGLPGSSNEWVRKVFVGSNLKFAVSYSKS